MVFMLLSTFLMGVAHFPPVMVPPVMIKLSPDRGSVVEDKGGRGGEEHKMQKSKEGKPRSSRWCWMTDTFLIGIVLIGSNTACVKVDEVNVLVKDDSSANRPVWLRIRKEGSPLSSRCGAG